MFAKKTAPLIKRKKLIIGLALALTCSYVHASEYRIAAMVDPQTFRTESGSDHNWDESRWERENKLTAESLRIANKQKTIKFGIINGDITEYGRTLSLDSSHKIYDLPFKTFTGLGNHDYANNVGECHKDICDIDMLTYVHKHIESKKNESNFSNNLTWHYQHGHIVTSYGSLAYSWDDGDIHYVQLQNHPSYDVYLNKHVHNTKFEYKKTSLMVWLADDLRKARKRGKQIILNMHDADQHFFKNTNETGKESFKKIINKNKVTVIYSDHYHGPWIINNKDWFGDVPVRVSDSLFHGGYYLVDIPKSGLSTVS